jgi:hypothetical protein
MSTPNSLEQIDKLYRFIRENGNLRPSNHRLGGIWSADIWDLKGYMAQLADDGASIGVGDAMGIIGWSTCNRPVEYRRGRTEEELLAMYEEFFPPTPEAAAAEKLEISLAILPDTKV